MWSRWRNSGRAQLLLVFHPSPQVPQWVRLRGPCLCRTFPCALLPLSSSKVQLTNFWESANLSNISFGRLSADSVEARGSALKDNIKEPHAPSSFTAMLTGQHGYTSRWVNQQCVPEINPPPTDWKWECQFIVSIKSRYINTLILPDCNLRAIIQLQKP